MLAGKRSGFTFVADASRDNRAYKGEMMQFARDQFAEGREADAGKMVEWLSKR